MQQFGLTLQLVAFVLPVGLYFLVLGLLNSRRRPQLLTGRQDAVLLTAALGPLFVLPVAAMLGLSLGHMFLVMVVLAGVASLLTTPGRSWVIYNLPREEAMDVLERSLTAAGISYSLQADGMRLEDGAMLHLSGFPLLRNVTVRLAGGSRELGDRLELSLGQTLARYRATTSSMAIALLLVATGMLMAPLALVSQQMPQIVRLLTDLAR